MTKQQFMEFGEDYGVTLFFSVIWICFVVFMVWQTNLLSSKQYAPTCYTKDDVQGTFTIQKMTVPAIEIVHIPCADFIANP